MGKRALTKKLKCQIKLLLITGVGPGTGSSLARRFSSGGYKVAMIARDKNRLKSLEDELDFSKGYSCELRNQEYLTVL